RNAETNPFQLQRRNQRQEFGAKHPPASRRYRGDSVAVAMNLRRGLILGWMMAGLQLLAAGQNSASQTPPSQSSTDSGVSGRTAPAAAVSGIVGIQVEGGTEDTSDT